MTIAAFGVDTASVRARAGLAAAALVGILSVSSWLTPGAPLLTICLFRLVTGWPCPSCGMTRAFIALGHGHLVEAVGQNLASPAIYMAAWIGLMMAAIGAITSRVPLVPVWRRVRGPVVAATLGLMSVAWVVNLIRAAGL